MFVKKNLVFPPLLVQFRLWRRRFGGMARTKKSLRVRRVGRLIAKRLNSGKVVYLKRVALVRHSRVVRSWRHFLIRSRLRCRKRKL